VGAFPLSATFVGLHREHAGSDVLRAQVSLQEPAAMIVIRSFTSEDDGDPQSS